MTKSASAQAATISRAFGPVSRAVCGIVDKLSYAVYKATRKQGDPRRSGGHRTLTHTWLCIPKTRDSYPDGVETVLYNTPEAVAALADADLVVANDCMSMLWTKKPAATYLQTWHGTPLKRMLHDLDTIVGRDEGYVTRVTKAARQWSVLTSPSAWTTERMRSAFRYTGPVVELGYPRNDIFFRPDRDEIAASVRRRLGVAPEKTVVLYAPTFRDEIILNH